LARGLKQRLIELLRSGGRVEDLGPLPGRKLISALLSAICRPEPEIKWPALAALGRAAAGLAEEDPEAGREVVRRLMWSLNDDSGAAGWGAAEALAEIMARSPALAEEFGEIFLGYLRPDPGSPDFEPLLQGVLWGLLRLAEARPELAARAVPFLGPRLRSPDPLTRALAARAAGRLRAKELGTDLEALLGDETPISLAGPEGSEKTTVGQAARRALEALDQSPPG